MAYNMENVDIAALEKLIGDIGKFNESMGNILTLMSRNVDNMQSVWADDQYNQFRDFMTDLVSGLRSDLQVMEGTKSSLVEMHRIMTQD